jgi:folate-binding protein YgfZ
MPENSAHYGVTDYAHERSPVTGFVALTHFGLIHCSGDDARGFLQGQLSCDVNALQTGNAIYGSYNTAKGRMLASFLLWRDDSGYKLQLPRSLCESIRKRLSMYVLRAKVKVLDISEDCALLGLVGTAATAELARLFGEVPTAALSFAVAAGAQLLRLDDARFQIVVQRERSGEIQKVLAAHTPPISLGAWDWTNIQAGIPYVTLATQDQFVPQMANLDLINGISFSKGCYPGQEIVARMHYLGKLKQRMYLATVQGEEIPQPGDKLYSRETGEQATGMIMNAAPTPEGRKAVLAVMHIESFKGGDVHLNSPAGPRLDFLSLPYAIPS